MASIADANGGFVVTSESKQRENVDPAQRTLDIKLVVRVPSTQFGVAFDEIKKLASNTPQENVSGQDVTEEFIDLEARIKTQKALEVQFLEIMRQAYKVADALEVQRQIADVRTEIEKLEGRKRFLENRSSLSTITVNIQTPKPVIAVTSTGFGQQVPRGCFGQRRHGVRHGAFLCSFRNPDGSDIGICSSAVGTGGSLSDATREESSTGPGVSNTNSGISFFAGPLRIFALTALN